jgi:DNA-binding transcriptional MerR regulator
MAVFEEVLMMGAFGRLVGLMPSAFRFYDDCGVLQPTSVDPATGYRLYTVQQERRAVLLRDLREMGLPLSAVRIVLDGPAQEASLALRDHVQSLEAKARQRLDTRAPTCQRALNPHRTSGCLWSIVVTVKNDTHPLEGASQ